MNKISKSLLVALSISSFPSFANESVVTEDWVSQNFVKCENYDSLIDVLINNGSISESDGNSFKCFAPLNWEWTSGDYAKGGIRHVGDSEIMVNFHKATYNDVAIKLRDEIQSALDNNKEVQFKVDLTNTGYLNYVGVTRVI
ncbi:hypothetical protein AB4483_25280, partial [Vibrio splendidus]